MQRPNSNSTSTASRSTALVLLAIVVTVLAWASAFLVIRGAGPHFSAGALALGRLIVGAVALSLLQLGRTWVKPTGRDLLFLAAFGVLWFSAYNVALNFAEQSLDAGTTAMIINIGPILIALGAGLFLGEGIPSGWRSAPASHSSGWCSSASAWAARR